MGDVTPDQIATFDQALADAENNLDVLIDLWRTGDPNSPEHIRIAGLCVALGERPEWDRIALAEHLTVAIRRLDRAGQAATPDGPRRWALPDEPGPEVRRLRPAERYPGDNSIWLDREPDNSGWRIVMRGRAGEPMEWVRAYSLGAGSVWGGRPLTDATPAADGQDGDGRG